MSIKKPETMEELLQAAPDTGFTSGPESNTSAEHIAHHSEEWKPIVLASSPGRPKRGEEMGSIVKSVRFPETVWDLLEKKAKTQHLNLHAALRAAVLEWASKH